MLTMSDIELNKTLDKLSSISLCALSNKTFKFISLAHHLNAAFLKDCYKHLDRNKAVGVDRVSWEEYGEGLDKKLDILVSKLKSKRYRPLPSKRVYIPKGKNELRPLGISAIETKIVEDGIAQILGSIYEADFLECSYGFRPKRSAHQALKVLSDSINFKPINFIVEADIKGFFDNVSHELLMDFLRIRVRDSSLLLLIERHLKAGYVENAELIKSEQGTPQGSILSPLLSNIFLHYVLDKWLEDVVTNHIKGYVKLVRYADDFVILVQTRSDAHKILRGLHNRFAKYKLQLHPNKTRVFSFGKNEKSLSIREARKTNTFDFLGFTHYCDKTRKGYFKVGRKTSAKKFRAKAKSLKKWFKWVRNRVEIKDWWKTLKTKLRGHYEYYGVSENSPSIHKFYRLAIKLAMKWMNRRSQKKAMSWAKMIKYLQLYPLPKPQITHSFYNVSRNGN